MTKSAEGKYFVGYQQNISVPKTSDIIEYIKLQLFNMKNIYFLRQKSIEDINEFA